MDTNKYAHQIIDDLLTLPRDKIVEVADFVHFIKEQVQNRGVPLRKAGLSREEAFDLRRRLATFENDWNAPGMEAYDNF